jgi:hypothetical protein
MSMIVCFRTATDNEIEAVLERPQRILKVFGLPEDLYKPGFLSRLFGRSRDASQPDDWEPDPDNEEFDTDKAWHGIHFLLTGKPWEGQPPLNFMVAGGREIGKIDVGYGPARCFTSQEVASVYEALEPITTDALKLKCDREAFRKNDIYPNIWDEPDDECFGYVLSYFEDLKAFMNRTRDSGKGLIVYLG